MSTITAIMEADAGGILHLPVPFSLLGGKVKVVASIEPIPSVADSSTWIGFGSMKRKIVMASDFDEPLENFRDDVE